MLSQPRPVGVCTERVGLGGDSLSRERFGGVCAVQSAGRSEARKLEPVRCPRCPSPDAQGRCTWAGGFRRFVRCCSQEAPRGLMSLSVPLLFLLAFCLLVLACCLLAACWFLSVFCFCLFCCFASSPVPLPPSRAVFLRCSASCLARPKRGAVVVV